MQWTRLTNPDQLQELIDISRNTPCLIFKHSTRCGISEIAQHRLKDHWPWDESQIRTFHVDVIESRAISDAIAQRFGIAHESPQVLLIREGRCIYHDSHLDISVGNLEEVLASAAQ
ncbi:MAG: thioredoxin family protein [Saprospiraceae bacterium]|nr:MAG: thioredoxin family protein [Saprospiraceae bacterium]